VVIQSLPSLVYRKFCHFNGYILVTSAKGSITYHKREEEDVGDDFEYVLICWWPRFLDYWKEKYPKLSLACRQSMSSVIRRLYYIIYCSWVFHDYW
jgi:hypothetical protein